MAQRLANLMGDGGPVRSFTYTAKGEGKKSWPLLGQRGTLIGTYTYDFHVTCAGGLIVAVEGKGRESRDFPLRRNLYRDNYCTGEFVRHRLDVVPVLSRETARDLGLDVFHFVMTYDPMTWPEVERDLARRKRQAAIAKGAHTRRVNAAREAGE